MATNVNTGQQDQNRQTNLDEQGFVIRGISFPSCGVRLVAVMTVAMLMEKATGGAAAMNDLSDWFEGRSGGGIAAAAFSMRGPGGDVPYTASQARDMIIRAAHAEFGDDPMGVMINNAIRDLTHQTGGDQISQIEPLISKIWPYIEPVMQEKLSAGRQNPVLGPLTGLRDRFLRHAIEGFGRKNMAVLQDILQTGLRAYVADHPYRYDHSILKDALQDGFGDTRVGHAYKSLFITAFNHTTKQTEMFGVVRGQNFPAHGHDSSLAFLKAGESAYEQTPVHTEARVVDALMAATSIGGIIGRYTVPGVAGEFGDFGEFSNTVLNNIMDEMTARAAAFLQEQQASAIKRRSILPFFGNNARQNITPTLVPRLLVIGAGYDPVDYGAAPHDPGVLGGINAFPNGAERAFSSPALASLRARYNSVSRKFTGQPAIVHISAPLIESADGPSSDITDGRTQNLAALTRFGADIFTQNADTIYQELKISLHTLRQRNEWSAEKYAEAVKNLDAHFASPESVKALCDSVVLSQGDVDDLVKTTNLPMPSSAPSAAAVRVAGASAASSAPALPAAQAAAYERHDRDYSFGTMPGYRGRRPY